MPQTAQLLRNKFFKKAEAEKAWKVFILLGIKNSNKMLFENCDKAEYNIPKKTKKKVSRNYSLQYIVDILMENVWLS